MASEPGELPLLSAAALVVLNEQAVKLRAELRDLHGELARAQHQLGTQQSSRLVAANEKLVVAAMQAESIAETAVSDLDALARSSQYDALTETPNRRLMRDRLDSAIVMARRRSAHLAVIFVDGDRFKEINDTQGHAVGDAVLQRVARQLKLVLRDSDTVSRHGGDEFLALLSEVRQASDAALIAGKMLAGLAVPHPQGDQLCGVSVSMGIAVYPEDGDDAETLIGHADAAMYRAKKQGGGRFEFHQPAHFASGHAPLSGTCALLAPPPHEQRRVGGLVAVCAERRRGERRQGRVAERRRHPEGTRS
ncbi:diguanylate cyclase [Rhodocyclus tenuis]|uniref:Diguanylate cyclase (GGDEF)-like protein n=1 Tax=Rhodocyclus tenuis TaxID=1066 RepID=A0A840FUI9_RHOTE|nr:diguanylate cyclase [Rhodocyclus tenuis]MBB4245747.1 diguanylate cyclase (GGDEF)-like protein [Rhodocyclus tenuis]